MFLKKTLIHKFLERCNLLNANVIATLLAVFKKCYDNLPALPRRCLAFARLIHSGCRVDRLFVTSKFFIFVVPQSITYTTSSIVMLKTKQKTQSQRNQRPIFKQRKVIYSQFDKQLHTNIEIKTLVLQSCSKPPIQ